MKPPIHPSTSRAPDNWKQKRLPVEAMPITDHHIDGVPCVASFWQPDASELAVLNAGGLVILNLVGRTMMPVSLTVRLSDSATRIETAADSQLVNESVEDLAQDLELTGIPDETCRRAAHVLRAQRLALMSLLQGMQG